jgi:hypothetical protein
MTWISESAWISLRLLSKQDALSTYLACTNLYRSVSSAASLEQQVLGTDCQVVSWELARGRAAGRSGKGGLRSGIGSSGMAIDAQPTGALHSAPLQLGEEAI